MDNYIRKSFEFMNTLRTSTDQIAQLKPLPSRIHREGSQDNENNSFCLSKRMAAAGGTKEFEQFCKTMDKKMLSKGLNDDQKQQHYYQTNS